MKARYLPAFALLLVTFWARAQAPGAELPPGHPPPSQDVSMANPSLPRGTVEVEVLDANESPVAGAEVQLWRVPAGREEDSASQEDRRARTGVNGKVELGGLEPERGMAYEVRVDHGPATFSSGLFHPSVDRGHQVTLHVYPATLELNQTEIALQTLAYVMPTDDAFQWELLVTVFNLGRVAWVTHDTRIGLPLGAAGIEAEPRSPAVGWIVEDRAARMVGTVPPGRHELLLRFHVRNQKADQAHFHFELPPRVAEAQVMAEGPPGMRLEVADAPPSQPKSGRKGQRLLFVRWQAPEATPLQELQVTLSGIPTPGPGRWIAVIFALALFGWGVWPARRRKAAASPLSDRDARRARSAVLDELVALERARRADVVGPTTYEIARGKLLRALAAIAPGRPGSSKPVGPRAARRPRPPPHQPPAP